MKYILIAFLLGCVLGGMLSLFLITQLAPPPEADSRETLDGLISEWIMRQRQEEPLLSLAVILELPDARPGYFSPLVRDLAYRLDTLYHIPEGVTLAQWALESNWGLSALGASNYFGHTYAAVARYMPTPRFILMREKVVTLTGAIVLGDTVRFARYRDIIECFNVHGLYLSQSRAYARAFAENSADAFAREMAKRYATDPDYGLKLVSIMKRYHL